jgi:formate/nitrite transporter
MKPFIHLIIFSVGICISDCYLAQKLNSIHSKLHKSSSEYKNKGEIEGNHFFSVPVNSIMQSESLNTVDETWKQLEDIGSNITNLTKSSIFARALVAGIFVGLGGILTASVGFDMKVLPWLPGNGLQRFFSGAVGFPLTILLVSMTGCGAWTGDMLLVARSFYGKKSTALSVLRMALISWLGCFVGAVLMAALATGAALPACSPCIAIAAHKLEMNFLQTFLRAVGAGTLICLAVFLSKLSRDFTGKLVGIWFPISTYVICDFEHVLASMFFLSCAKMNGANISIMQMINFFVPATLGNMCGGALLVASLASIPRRTRLIKF